MSLLHRFSLAASALLVIDAQDNFKATAAYWARRNNLAFEANVASLVTAYREANLPIYYVLHSDSDPGWETTTRVAADLGYDVDFVIDATLTFPIPYREDGKLVGELGVAEIEERTRFVLRDRFARIVDTAQLINEIKAS
jgi:nicotinamidase-related amidase